MSRRNLLCTSLFAALLFASVASADVDVTVRLVDQYGIDYENATFNVLDVSGDTYATGSTVSLAEGEHLFRVVPSYEGYPVHFTRLRREERIEVTAATTEIVFEWITSEVELRLQDQYGVDISGSHITVGGQLVPTGGTITLPLTDESVYPGMLGNWVDGYDTYWMPSVQETPVVHVAKLSRLETLEVTETTTSEVQEWITSDVTLRLLDQNGDEIVGSGFSLWGGFRNTGDTVTLPITDESVYPNLNPGCLWCDGHPTSFWPGVNSLQPKFNRLLRSSAIEVTETTTEAEFEWITRDVFIQLVDQDGDEIAGSRFQLRSAFTYDLPTGSIFTLPLTDETFYPTLVGSQVDGYPFNIKVGLAGQTPTKQFERSFRLEVGENTSDWIPEWIQVDCPIQLVNSDREIVSGSAIALPNVYPAIEPGDLVTFPITDNSVYPTIVGTQFADGYRINVTPGDLAPANATYQFEVLANGTLEPETFELEGNTYSLICVDNQAPIADAGPNLEIASSEQATTVIAGTASDPDSAALTYRWLEGTNELLATSTVGPDGQAELDLGELSPLTVGPHVLTLEVSDGAIAATSEMTLVIDNSAPVLACPGGPTVQAGDDVTLAASVADHDGDDLTYQWNDADGMLASGVTTSIVGGDPVALPGLTLTTGAEADLALGGHLLELTVDDGANPAVSCNVAVTVVDTEAPTIVATADAGILWPPNGQMREVVIDFTAEDGSGGDVTVEVAVTSSEDPLKAGSGQTIPDWAEPVIDLEAGTITLELRAERSGKGPGRTYTVSITVTDEAGNTSESVLTFEAPHDRGNG